MESREHLIPKQNISEKTWKKTELLTFWKQSFHPPQMFRSRVRNPEKYWKMNKCSAQQKYSIIVVPLALFLDFFSYIYRFYLELIYINIKVFANVDRLVS